MLYEAVLVKQELSYAKDKTTMASKEMLAWVKRPMMIMGLSCELS